jgi:hypothetical protein
MASNVNKPLQVFKSSIARIYHDNGSVVGVGFLVSESPALVLTCAHVIAEALSPLANTYDLPVSKIKLDFPFVSLGSIESQKTTAKVVLWNPVGQGNQFEDIAGLELLDALPNGVNAVPMHEVEDLSKQEVEIFGFPRGHGDSGVWVRSVLGGRNAKGWLQLGGVMASDYSVERGFSGAPVWDALLGGAVGMVVAIEGQRENIKVAFAIPSNILKPLCETFSNGYTTSISMKTKKNNFKKNPSDNSEIEILEERIAKNLTRIKNYEGIRSKFIDLFHQSHNNPLDQHIHDVKSKEMDKLIDGLLKEIQTDKQKIKNIKEKQNPSNQYDQDSSNQDSNYKEC